MSRSLLNGFGPTEPVVGSRASSGGVTQAKVEHYSPPVGPKHVMNEGVGLRGGTTFGDAGSQGKGALRAAVGGRPGQHVTRNYGGGTNG